MARVFLLFAIGITLASPLNAAIMTAFPDMSNKTDFNIEVRAAINRDTRYGIWSAPTGIPYRLDPAYTSTEQALITSALNQITTDMNQCIRFIVYNNATNFGVDHLYIGKTMNDGTTPLTCFSFPGRYATQQGRGQKVAIFPGTNGCMGNQREVMKYIIHALGLRNEINRPDRNQYIQVFTQNVRPELQSISANLLKAYTPTQVDYLNTLFDFNSITIPSPDKFANPGQVLFTSAQSTRSFGTLARLSQGDCQGLSLLYSTCTLTSCTNPYPADGFNGITGSTSTFSTISTATFPFTVGTGATPFEPQGGNVPILP